MLAITLHGITDFNMQIPANALMFFFLLGMTYEGREVRKMGREEVGKRKRGEAGRLGSWEAGRQRKRMRR